MSGAVRAALNYLGQMNEKPRFHVFDVSRHNLNLVPHTVDVRDARSMQQEASLTSEGFCLIPHRTSASHLESRREVLRVYGPEIEELITGLTGAKLAIAEPLGVVRVAAVGASTSKALTHSPIHFVHADFSAGSAQWLIHRLLSSRVDAPVESVPRCLVFNVWRSLTPAPQDLPLAVCDVRTTDSKDTVAADSVLDFPGSRPGITETTLFRFNARHRWYYYPDMTPNEVLIFKSFDSESGHSGRVPHTAFRNPACGHGVPTRTSLDLRVVAVF